MTDNIPHYTGLAENPKNSITKARKFPQDYQTEKKKMQKQHYCGVYGTKANRTHQMQRQHYSGVYRAKANPAR